MPRAALTDVVPRRTLVIIAVVVALAVIGTVLAFIYGGGDDSGSKGSKSGDTKAAASSGVTAGSGGKDATSGSHTDSGDKTDGATGSAGDGSSGSTPSTGASSDASATNGTSGDGKESGSTVVLTYKGSQGFSIGLPKGWKYVSTEDAGARFTGPDGQKLLVGWTTTPKSDPVADWKNQEGYMTRSQYKRVRIEKVDYRNWNTADWEFTYQEGGTKYRTIDRGFVVNSHMGYGLMYTAKASDWDSQLRKDTWQTLTATFEPKS